ncbi:MAG: amidohydrolase family protein [Chloroflexota bacterium]|nr:amidohydrolase family protein [Chloroflexota bacterium]
MASAPPAIIDTHVHLLQPSRFHYHWLTKDSPLFQDWQPGAVFAECRSCGVRGGILIEATNTQSEIDCLLEVAAEQSAVWGVIGWINLDAPDALAHIAHYSEHPCFCGVRLNWLDARLLPHMLDDALRALADANCVVEVLTQVEHLSAVTAFAKDHPRNCFVVDHFGGRLPEGEQVERWQAEIKPLAALPNVALKLSGYATASAALPPVDHLARVLAYALNSFGAERLLYGSNYPMFTPTKSMVEVLSLLREACAQTDDELQQIFYETPRKIYQLGV